MKGFIKLSAAGFCFCGLLITLAGCSHYRDCVDPCWPERYNFMARDSVRAIHNAQADKGHILDQTVWNWMFEVDAKTGGPSDRINAAGIEHLKYLSRRQPAPDFHIYLQNAQDVAYSDAVAPEIIVKQRNFLNDRRIASIQRFLATQSAVHGGGAYQVAIHDFAPPGINATPIIGTEPRPKVDGSVPLLEKNFKGSLPDTSFFIGAKGM